MSPLTQGLNYRSACDKNKLSLLFVKYVISLKTVFNIEKFLTSVAAHDLHLQLFLVSQFIITNFIIQKQKRNMLKIQYRTEMFMQHAFYIRPVLLYSVAV